MKTTISKICDFLAENGLEVRRIKIKANENGVLIMCTGWCSIAPFDFVADAARLSTLYALELSIGDARLYRSKLHFHNVGGKIRFIITSNQKHSNENKN